MKIRSTIAAVIVFTAALAAQAATTGLFPETFDGNDQDWSYTSSGARSYDKTWTEGGTVKPGYKGVKLGSTSATGSIASEVFSLDNTSEDVVITVVAAAYLNNGGGKEGIALTVYNSSGSSIYSGGVAELTQHTSTKNVEIPANQTYTHSFTVPSADLPSSGGISLKIESTYTKTGQRRALIGDVLVTQESSGGGGGGDEPPAPVALAVPTGLSASEVDDSGFSLAWEPVENADGYSVEVKDSNGNDAGSVSFDSTTATVTGLLSDTTYKVRVKALDAEGSEEYVASDWSFPISVTTDLADGLVRENLLEENFSEISTTTWTSTSYSSTKAGDSGTWTGVDLASSKSAIIVGRASKGCSVDSPVITLVSNAVSATVRISFDAAAYNHTTDSSLSLSVVDMDSGTTNAVQTYSNIDKLPATAASVADAGFSQVENVQVPESFKLVFTSFGYGRVYLDSIVVSQVVNPSLVALAAPVATAGEATITSLAFSWGAVAGATGYAVELRDGSGARVAYDAAFNGTATNFTDLNWNSDYTIRVKALGDDSTSCNSPWSAGVTGRTLQNLDAPAFTASADASAAVMAVVSNKTFSVSAERDGAPLAVSFGGLSPAASGTAPTFSSGTFSWTPSAGDEGKTFTATFTTDSGRYSTNIVFGVLARPELVEPAIKTNAVACNAATVLWDAPPQIRAVSYDYRLWSGSDTPTDVDVDQERFHDRVLPAGWVLSGTGWQPGSSFNANPVKFDDAGDFAISALYPASVTNLAFTLHKTKGTDSPVVKFYASTGSTNALAWTEVPIELDPGKATKNFQLEFRAADGYRRFKWVYVTKDSNVNLGSVAAKYEGAGVKFKAGSATEYVAAPSGNVLDLTGLRSETNYFLEVRVADESGTKKSATLRFSTLAAPKMTLMVFK